MTPHLHDVHGRSLKAFSCMWQVKESVQEKFMSEEALEEKRKEEARKKRWGPFGIFPKGT